MDNNSNNNDDFSQALNRFMEQGRQIIKQVADEVTVRMESADLDDLTRKAEEALGRKAAQPSPPAPKAPTPPPVDEAPAAKVTRFRDGRRVDDEEAPASKVSRFSNGELVEDSNAADEFEELFEQAEREGFTPAPVNAADDAPADNEPAAEDEVVDEDLADRALALAEEIAQRLNLPQETVDRIRAEGEKAAFTVAIAVGQAQQKLDGVKGRLDEPTRKRLTELMIQAGTLAGQARSKGGTSAAEFAAKTKKAQHEALLKKAQSEMERHKKDAHRAAVGLAASTALYALLKARPKP